jgi:hypothetical protein
LPAAAPKFTQAAKEALLARFDVEDHKTNPKGYTYIAIEKVINRFIEVDPSFEIAVTQSQYAPLPGLTYGRRQVAAAYALVTVAVTILGVTRAGTGGDYGAADDVDKLIKTAYAEAIKKAGHEFGVGLYLWDEEERALIKSAQDQGLTGQVAPVGVATAPAPTPPGTAEPTPAPLAPPPPGDVQTLKDEVTRIALAAGVQMTAPAIAAHFSVPVEALQSAEVLRQIVEAQSAAPAAV